MTAKALLVQVNTELLTLPRHQLPGRLDLEIVELVLRGKALSSPACLAPLPLAGVPGWWPRAAQNDGQFYMDSDVFRQPPAGLKPAPVLHLAWSVFL